MSSLWRSTARRFPATAKCSCSKLLVCTDSAVGVLRHPTELCVPGSGGVEDVHVVSKALLLLNVVEGIENDIIGEGFEAGLFERMEVSWDVLRC